MNDVLLLVLVGILVLVFLLPFLIGLLIAPSQQATRVELVKAPLDEVWAALSDLSRQTEWRDDLKSMQLKDDDEGMRWVELPVHGPRLVLRKIKEVPKKELVVQLERGKTPRGKRQAVFTAVPGGTRVTFTETSEISNPLGRFRAHIGSKLDKRLNHYIAQLKKHFAG
ncbi:MAG: SRPBCC family protein [Thiothrix sp.]|nr:SRPBCC family protein [Thiothrix sp.]HPE61673.1 SRPBCC family protein [Thiolinea sp.]